MLSKIQISLNKLNKRGKNRLKSIYGTIDFVQVIILTNVFLTFKIFLTGKYIFEFELKNVIYVNIKRILFVTF